MHSQRSGVKTWLRFSGVRFPPQWDKPKRPCSLKCTHTLRRMCMCAHPSFGTSITCSEKTPNCPLGFDFHLHCRYWFANSKKKKKNMHRAYASARPQSKNANIRTHTRTHASIYVNIRTYNVRMRKHTIACVHIRKNAYIHVQMRTYTYRCAYTRTHL